MIEAIAEPAVLGDVEEIIADAEPEGGDIVKAINDAEHNEATVETIDAILAGENPNGDDKEEVPNAPTVLPNNYRPPPEQNIKPRERRERPNIFDHGLLKSMDLSFVGGGRN